MSEQACAVSDFAPAETAAAKWADLFSGRNAVYSITFGGSVALHALNIYIVATIMPSVIAEIGGLDYYAWSTTVFVVASILSAALSGHLLDRAGPRQAYALAALLFAAGTLACALAPDMKVLLAGRTLQGFGGGFLYALTYGVVRLVYPPNLQARAIGFSSMMWGISTLAGPAVGGIWADFGLWRGAFWSLIPLAALFGALAVCVLPRGDSRSGAESGGLPVVQLVLLALALLALSAGSVGGVLSHILWGIAATAVLLGGLVWAEGRGRVRLLPAGALKAATPLGAIYATIALLLIGMQPEVFAPYLLQVLHAQSPLASGYLAALMALGWTLGSISSAGAEGAARRIIVAGPVASLAGLALTALSLPVPSEGDWLLLAPASLGFVLVGLGIGMIWPHLVTRIYRTARENEQSLASSAITTVQLFATALGAALTGAVANIAGIGDGVAGASNAAAWLWGLFMLAPALAVLTALRVART